MVALYFVLKIRDSSCLDKKSRGQKFNQKEESWRSALRTVNKDRFQKRERDKGQPKPITEKQDRLPAFETSEMKTNK